MRGGSRPLPRATPIHMPREREGCTGGVAGDRPTCARPSPPRLMPKSGQRERQSRQERETVTGGGGFVRLLDGSSRGCRRRAETARGGERERSSSRAARMHRNHTEPTQIKPQNGSFSLDLRWVSSFSYLFLISTQVYRL